MNAHVLVLNQAGFAIDIFDWKKAVRKVWNNKADIVREYTDTQLQDWSALCAPSIIRLSHFMNPPKKHRYEPFTRKNVWVRDKGLCQYCGKFVSLKQLTLDHVVPKSQGGKTNWYNIVTAHSKCNSKKDNRTPEQAGMKLLNKPKAPVRELSMETMRQEVVLRVKSLKNLPDEAWRTYIYFNAPLEQDA